jgi:pimeloyl-ACP methyl ester carboxylesterase
MKKRLNNKTEQFYIFGHSAGSQFVHRLLMYKPDLPVAMAIAANAGWYTLPTDNQQFPYGLAGSGVKKPDLKKFFALPLVVLLGDQDIDTQDPNLRTAPEANLQGPHRFARGQNYYSYARDIANAMESPFNWQLQVAPGIAHENDKMAPYAARLIKKFIETGSL